MSSTLKIYHSLPHPLRTFAASLRGFYLNQWRYGKDSEVRVQAALERERWSKEEWACWQEERLQKMLAHASSYVPHYRSLKGTSFAGWPVLEKETLRQNPESLLAEGTNKKKMFAEHTSGTTGTPLTLWLSQKAVREWYALFEARCRRWYGVSRQDRWGILGGQLIVPASASKPPYWIWNAGMNQLYLSVYHISPQSAPDYLKAIRDYRLLYLYGYPSALYALAQEAQQKKITVPLKVVVTNAEPLFDYQRKTIEEVFKCPARQTYGMSEAVTAASECEKGEMHLWPDAGITEVMHPDAEGNGDLVCTGLLNEAMPLVRYRVGDRGSLAEGKACACGRTLPLLKKIEGRSDDMLYTIEGKAVGRLDPVFKSGIPIKEAQVIQEDYDTLRVLYVPAGTSSNLEIEKKIGDALRERFGKIKIQFESVAAVPRTKNGKFRAVISKVKAPK